MRLILIGAAVFLIPFVVWAGLQYVRARNPGGQTVAPVPPLPLVDWRKAPWQTLILIGMALAVVFIAALLITDGTPSADCDWVPSRVVDGKLEPAHCR